MAHLIAVAVAALTFVVTTVAGAPVAQAFTIERPDLTTEGPWKDSTLRLEVSNRARGEFVDWFDMGPATNARYAFFGNRFQAGVRLTHPNLEAFFQFQHSLIENLPENGMPPGAVYFANTRDTFQQAALLRQAWFRAKTHLEDDAIALTVGRTRFADGTETTPRDPALRWIKSNRVAERLLGPFDYPHIGRSFDGLTLAYDRGDVNVTGFWQRPTSGGYEISGGRHIEDINILGASVTTNAQVAGNPTDARLFWVHYSDDRNVLRNQDVAPLGINIDTIGANAAYIVPVGYGNLDLLAWAAGQTGDWSLNQEHRAWAYSLELGYQLPDVTMSPWARAGFFRSSGDDDPSDNNHETFFQMLPTARLYAMTPFYNMMNNQDAFVQLLLKPVEKVGVRTEFHWLRVTEPRDLAYFGGGATKEDLDFFGFGGIPTGGNRDLGFLADIAVTWTPCDFFAIYAYYSHVFGEDILRDAFARSDANYGFIETTLSF